MILLLGLLLILCPHPSLSFSPSRRARLSASAAWAASSELRDPGNAVHIDEAAYAVDTDQKVYLSEGFWSLVDKCINLDDPALDRFYEFCMRLQSADPAELNIDPECRNRELLAQYTYPGLPPGKPYHDVADLGPWAEDLFSAGNGGGRFAATARRELLENALPQAPLQDDSIFLSGRAEPSSGWRPAAWYGWQFLPLRSQREAFRGTIQAMRDAGVPRGHRFCGIARQKADTVGSTHSDRRNYMLSTLTGLVVPRSGGGGGGEQEDCCTITVAGERRVIREGQTLVLDNTFPHSVANAFDPKQEEEGDVVYGGDRFVLMIEVWHPDLSDIEVESLRTLFALKDLYTVLGVSRAPWGYADAELEDASARGVLNDLSFWRDL